MNHDNPNDATHNLPQANQPPNQPQEDKVVSLVPQTDSETNLPAPKSAHSPLEMDGETADLVQIIPDETVLRHHLTDRQLSALPDLIGPGSITQRARNAGIARATLYRWLQDPGFRDTFESIQKDVLHLAEVEAQSMAKHAVSVIFDLMSSGNQKVRLDAARTALKLAQDARQSEQIDQRLENIEMAQAIRKKAQWPGI